MPLERSVFFPPFRLDLANEQLWRLAQPLPLRPKTFAVLRCFVEHPGQLLTKKALFEAVWPETVVSDVVLKVCIRELRSALGDNARQPQFIETVHGWGYRFIGAVTAAPQPAASPAASKRMAKLQSPVFAGVRLDAGHGPIVGREVDLAYLHQCLDKVWSSARQVIFVTGGIGLGRAPVLAQLAEAYWHTGQTAEGLRLLAEALAVMDRTGEHWWEAEVHRLKGELLLAQEDTRQKCVKVEECFRHALEVARHQQAKSLELRAAMSMSRLWQRQGRCAAAYHLLAEIYGWFTEGFDTVDLQEAKALLKETGGPMSMARLLCRS